MIPIGVVTSFVPMFDHIEYIAAESLTFAALARSTAQSSRVPCCPDWSFRDLVCHLGEVQRFWAANVRQMDTAGPWRGEVPQPGPGVDLAEWYEECAADLVATLRSAEPDDPCWTWWGDPATSAAVARHQAQEAAVHRWDAQSVTGRTDAIAPALAADALDEFVGVSFGSVDSLPGAVVLNTTDTGHHWQVGGGDPAATMRATASDLLLLLYHRIDLDNVTVVGTVAAAEALLALADTE